MTNHLVPVRISSCGGRPVSAETKVFGLVEEQIGVCYMNEICLQASLISGISRVVGSGYARALLLQNNLSVMKSFSVV